MTTDRPIIGAEVIRKRPGMYIGDVYDGSGLTHLVWELVANSLDQCLAGRCNRIDVIIEQDGSVVVEDDGPGIPIAEIDGRPFVEVALTQHHTTPTFDGHAPHEHIGRYGVGLFVLNALSSRMIIDIFRDGFHYNQKFARGIAVSRLEKVAPTSRTGTRVSLLPDPAIFSDPWFNAGTIAARLRELAWLLPTVTLTFTDRREHVFHEPRGLKVFLERTRPGHSPIGGTLLVNKLVGMIRVEAAIQWLPRQWTKIESFANVERTTDGGTHVQGLLDGLARALRVAIPTWKRRPKKAAMEAVKRGLHAVVCVRLQDPSYDMPTKSRLVTPEAQNAVSTAVGEAFVEFIHSYEALVEYLAQAEQ